MDDLTKNVLIQRMVSKAGLRSKVDAKCMECIYDPHASGTWRKQVEECTSKTCPLYSSRPIPTNK